MSATENDNTSLVKTPTITLRILEDLSPDEEDEDVEEAVGRFVWPTAMPLLRHMLSQQQPLKGSSVLVIELGAGCGVLGMGLAAQDDNVFSHVIVTDHDSDWLQKNVALNETALREAKAAKVEVGRLDWGNPEDIAAIENRIQELLFQLNENKNSDDGHATSLMLVASDVLYNHHSHKALAALLWQLSSSAFELHQQPTRIIIGFPDRDNDEQSFLPFARAFFGDTFPSSQPILTVNKRKTNKPRKQMDLRVIDFTVNHE